MHETPSNGKNGLVLSVSLPRYCKAILCLSNFNFLQPISPLTTTLGNRHVKPKIRRPALFCMCASAKRAVRAEACQEGGCEAAVHAVRLMFEDENCQAVLLVDASNAFNALNRKAALHNVFLIDDNYLRIAQQELNPDRGALLAELMNTELSRSKPGEVNGKLKKHRCKRQLAPKQLLFGRNLRSKVLSHPSVFQQHWREQRDPLDRAATTLAAKAKAQHDLRAKPLSVLQPGTVVRVQHPRTKRWPRSQKWWSARLAGAAIESRQRAVACSGATALPAPLLSLSRCGVRLDLVVLPCIIIIFVFFPLSLL